MGTTRCLFIVGPAILAALLSGCAKRWEPAWSEAGPSNPTRVSQARLESARERLAQAGDAGGGGGDRGVSFGS